MSNPLLKKYQLGGEIPQQPLLAERGEVFQDSEGTIQQVSPKAPSHDDRTQVNRYGIKKVDKGSGGVIIDADKVLSDSYTQVKSGKRKSDDKENIVKITSSEGELLAMQIGIDLRLKSSLSPSQLFLKIQAERDKIALKLLKSQDNVTDSIQNRNAIVANKAQLEALPTDEEIYDLVFNHQEESKEESGIEFEETTSKYGGCNLIKKYL